MLSLDYLSENIDEANIYKGPLADSSLERRFLPMSRRLAWLASESGLLQVPPTVFTRFSKIVCKTHTATGFDSREHWKCDVEVGLSSCPGVDSVLSL